MTNWGDTVVVLTPQQARKFYDRFGVKQDAQAFYEDAALDELIAHAAFEQATSIFEFGCGTGRLASRLLAEHLPSGASYFGIDISSTMIGMAGRRISRFGERAKVAQSEGHVVFPVPDQSIDRVVSTYVLDLLSESDILKMVAEARRVLRPDGKLCLVSLTKGNNLSSRLVSSLWSTVFQLYAPLVGGCRPIQIESFISRQDWSTEYRNVVARFGVPSEILIGSPSKCETYEGPVLSANRKQFRFT